MEKNTELIALCENKAKQWGAIIYADSTESFAVVAGEKAREVQQQMAVQLKKL